MDRSSFDFSDSGKQLSFGSLCTNGKKLENPVNPAISVFDILGKGTRLAGRYVLEGKLARGSFGEVLQATDETTGGPVAIKFEPKDSKDPQLQNEFDILIKLSGKGTPPPPLLRAPEGFPAAYHYGSVDRYTFLVMELLGPSLGELFESCGNKFSLKTVLMLNEQMLERLITLHSLNIVHRDMKPENWMMGTGSKSKTVFLIDFGLGRSFITDDGTHRCYRESGNLTGTARYASTNAHCGGEQSRRDDMESLGYLIIHFVKGSLPWQGCAREKNGRDRIRAIEVMKIMTNTEMLCEGLPVAFCKYMEYVKNLEFKSKPDYKYMRRLFQKLLYSMNWSYDNAFDWLSDSKHSSYANNKVVPLSQWEDDQNPVDGEISSDKDGYRDKCPICLWRNPERGGKEQYYPIVEGCLGSDKKNAQIEVDGAEPIHSKIIFDHISNAYAMKDMNSQHGSFLLLSVERRCRQTIELRKGDRFIIGQGIEITVLSIEYCTQVIQPETSKMRRYSKMNRPSKRVTFNERINVVCEDNNILSEALMDYEEPEDNAIYFVKSKLRVEYSTDPRKPQPQDSSLDRKPAESKIYTIRGSCTIGTHATCTITVPSTCCPVHCKLLFNHDKLFLRDLSIGDPNGSRFFLARPIELFERDIIILGSLELGIMPVSDCPLLESVWSACCIRLTAMRKTKRTPLYSRDKQSKLTRINKIPMEGEVIIGRNDSCEVIFNDYRIAERHACMYFEPIEKKFYLESIVISRSQVTLLLLGRANSSTKSPYCLKQGDVFCVGSSQIEVSFIKVETVEEKERRENAMSNPELEVLWMEVKVFTLLPQYIFQKVVNSLQLLTYSEGEIIASQGDIVPALYIVFAGTVDVLLQSDGQEVIVKTLSKFDTIGEFSIVQSTNYDYTARASQNCEIWALDAVLFLSFVEPYMNYTDSEYMKKDVKSLCEILKPFPMFQNATLEVLLQFSNALVPYEFNEGDDLMKIGVDQQDSVIPFHIIIAGHISSYPLDPNGTGSKTVIAHIGPGEYIGEMANPIIPFTERFIADDQVQTLSIPEKKFQALVLQLMVQRFQTKRRKTTTNRLLEPTALESPEINVIKERSTSMTAGVVSVSSDEELQIGDETDEMALINSNKTLSQPHYIVLKAISGPMRQEIFAIESDYITIGQGICTIQIRESSLSNIHCVIEYRDGGYWLSDSDSEQGTFLQLAVGMAFPIQVGDVFHLGNTEMTILGKTEVIHRDVSPTAVKPMVPSKSRDGPTGEECCAIA